MKKTQRNYKRLVLGDVIEIPLSNEHFAYAQYVYNHREPPVWGQLIRVLPGLFKSRPETFRDLVLKPHRFCTFFIAGAALKRGMIKIVSHEEIPEDCQELPLFKAYNENFQTGKKTWFLWDGKRDRQVGELSPEYYDLSLKEIRGFDVLVEATDSGWSPRDEVSSSLRKTE